MRRTSHIFVNRIVIAIVVLVGLLITVLYGLPRFLERRKAGVVIPDEKTVALELLAQKFTGPGYFHASGSLTNKPSRQHDAEFYITASEAQTQKSRVVQERQFGRQGATNLDTLIARLTEPPKSRAVGEAEVNLLRLNLALDALDKK